MTQQPSGTVAEVGEFGLIEAITPCFRQTDVVEVGPGDDAAVLRSATGRTVVSTDLLIERRHFRRDWSAAVDIGHKAAAANLSDINAMGGRATSAVVAFGAPGDLPVAWAVDLATGIAAECEQVGAAVVGGDVTASDVVVISVTVLGECDGEPVLRGGARPGDVVAVRGRLGWAAAGFHVLGRGFRSPRAVVEAHQRPQPPYSAGPQAAAHGATAMIDLSDGLLADLGHVARASKVAIDVRSASFEIAEPLQAVGAALGVDPMRFILTGGEDYALAAAFPAEPGPPEGWLVVGEVYDGSGVTVDGGEYGDVSGFQHFR